MKIILFLSILFLCDKGVNAQRNPNNPFDRVGEMHNYLLDAFFTEQTRESVSGIWTMQTLGNFICKKFPDMDCKSVHQIINDKLYMEVRDKTLMECESILLGRGLVHARHGYYIDQINDIIENHFDEDYNVSYKAFLTIEDKLINDPDLSPSEVINLLCSCAVGRYSIKFWKDIGAGLGRYPSISSDITNLTCCAWLRNLGNHDTRGAVAGAIIGASSGSGGGATGLAGAGVGALVGGGAASISSGVSSIWQAIFN